VFYGSGLNGHYAYAAITGQFYCNDGTFAAGSYPFDPNYGIGKHCYSD